MFPSGKRSLRSVEIGLLAPMSARKASNRPYWGSDLVNGLTAGTSCIRLLEEEEDEDDDEEDDEEEEEREDVERVLVVGNGPTDPGKPGSFPNLISNRGLSLTFRVTEYRNAIPNPNTPRYLRSRRVDSAVTSLLDED
jgi:hypothetical protein